MKKVPYLNEKKIGDMFHPVPIEQEPKRVNRFVVEFPEDVKIESFLVQTATRPKATISKIGKIVWDDINIEMIDCIGPSATMPIMKWIREHEAENIVQKILRLLKIGKTNYKKDLVIKSLDPCGETIEVWNLIGCEIKKADFTGYDVADDSVLQVKLILKIEKAELIMSW